MQKTKIKIYMHPKLEMYGCDDFGNIFSFRYEKKKMMKTITINTGYKRLCLRYKGKGVMYLVSRFCAECYYGKLLKKGITVDHKDHDLEDNSKNNLRICTQSKNKFNSIKKEGCTSKYKGVCATESGKWKAYIRVCGRLINAGTFINEIDAAKAYNRLAVEHAAEYALLNEIPKDAKRK